MAIFRVELEHTDWQMMLNILGGGAYRDVAPLIQKISQQLQEGPLPAAGNGEVKREQSTPGSP